MSIRIHKLAEEIGMENKDLLVLLKDLKFISSDVKSVSSTLSDIYAEEIRSKYSKKPDESVAAPVAESVQHEAPVPVTVTPSDSSGAFTTSVPTGAFVRTANDVARDKEELVKAAAAARSVVSAPAAVRPVIQSPIKSPVAAPVSAPRPVSAPAPSQPTVLSPPRPATASPSPVSLPLPVAKSPSQSPALPPAIPRGPAATPALPGAKNSPAALPPAVTPAHVPVITDKDGVKIIHLKPPVVVRDFATDLGIKPFKLISELMEMGIFASMNQTIDETVATKIAEKHGFLLEIKHRGDPAALPVKKDKQKTPEVIDETTLLEPRPPVVCILGHVDHGKTSLLDAIRKADVAAGEAGGITQHIGAYQIEFNKRKITFLDTPGHAAFTKMRARGADVTDIAILVVAADDGFMPQTDEALKHAQNAEVSLIVAVNKMDVKGANLDRVKTQMQERGIPPEDWGGETPLEPVAAIKGQGINELLEMIVLQADVLELKANPKAEASGVIIESEIEVGRGSTATVIVQRGTLRVGDALVCGPYYTKVKALFDDQGRQLKEAPPSTPVKIIGWSGTPDSGATFKAVKNEREAKQLAEEQEHKTRKENTVTAAVPKDVSLDALFKNIADTKKNILRVVVKCDVYGSVEAVRNVLESIKSNKVSLEIVSAEVGLISKNDVLMASAAGAIILGFSTKQENGVNPVAKHHNVRIETFDIIYELGDKVRELMADLLEPDLKELKQGAAEVRQVFPVSKGFVAGCLVTEGKITRNSVARVRRGREIPFEGKVGTLKRFKDDANEVRAGLECGIRLDGFDNYQPGDIIECFEVQKVRASL